MRIIRAGLVGYEQAWQLQREVHADRVDGVVEDTVLLLEHPPVYTAGKRTRPDERPIDGTPVIDVDRGGNITWHGPGQLVGYPIIALAEPIDVVAYVRQLEDVLIGVCTELGLDPIQVDGRTGVWIAADIDPRTGSARPERKVAAIGVRVAQKVTLHGFAINCDPDLSAFDRIVPCGITDAGVTSLSAELDRSVTVTEVIPIVERLLPELVAVARDGRVAAPAPVGLSA